MFLESEEQTESIISHVIQNGGTKDRGTKVERMRTAKIKLVNLLLRHEAYISAPSHRAGLVNEKEYPVLYRKVVYFNDHSNWTAAAEQNLC